MERGIVQKFLALPFSFRQSTLARKRHPISYSDFVSFVIQADGDAQAADLIFSKLQDWIYNEGFTAHPEDSLGMVFGIAEEELDEDIIFEMLVKLNIPIPTQQEVLAFGPIDSAVEVAQFVSFARTGINRKKNGW